MQQSKHEALYDCFSVIKSLEHAMGGVSRGEVGLYCYLACLLSLFSSGRPYSLWGYKFAHTEHGTPYSAELMDALKDLTLRGDIVKEGNVYITSSQGRFTWAMFEELYQFSRRTAFLKAATDCVLALPTSSVRYALYNEPSIKSAELKHKASDLLGEVVLGLLHDQFSALKETLGNIEDLFIPATVWMSYLYEESRTNSECAND